ncbi:MAG: AsmA-like C-terminal region-containing protein, partial [Chromatiales bacterium]|jgi:hypothetical protein
LRLGLLEVGEALEQLPAHELEMQFTAQGQTYQKLASSLNGDFHLAGGRGRTINAGLDKTLGDFFGELSTTINPFIKQEKYTQIECTAASLKMKDGVVLLDPGFVIRTDKIDISAIGRIDLHDESVDVHFKNTPRRGLGLSAAGLINPFIKVGGKLASPHIELDAPRALVSGTAAVATSGLSLLLGSLIDRVSSANNPCKQVIINAEQQRQQNPGK